MKLSERFLLSAFFLVGAAIAAIFVWDAFFCNTPTQPLPTPDTLPVGEATL